LVGGRLLSELKKRERETVDEGLAPAV